MVKIWTLIAVASVLLFGLFVHHERQANEDQRQAQGPEVTS
jgi:hypothetical protein